MEVLLSSLISIWESATLRISNEIRIIKYQSYEIKNFKIMHDRYTGSHCNRLLFRRTG